MFARLEQAFALTSDPNLIARYLECDIDAILSYHRLEPKRFMVRVTRMPDRFIIEGDNYYTMLLLQGLYVEGKYTTGDVIYGNGAYYSCQYGFMKSYDPIVPHIPAKSLLVRKSQMLLDYKRRVATLV